ncbi:amino acid adenylation domain-containing protein [Chryseobacterium sp. 1B4]
MLSNTSSLLIFLDDQTDSQELLNLVSEPFDLVNDQLVRFYIMGQDDEKYRIIYVFSSILIDRLTDNFLYSELGKYYNNSNYCNPISLAEQFRLLDEMNNEVRAILNTGQAVIADFWSKHLENIENPGFKFLEVYNDNTESHRIPIDELNFEFSEEVLSKMKLLAENYKLSPYAFGQMILAILLHRISGVNQLIIDYPVSIKKQQNYILSSHVNTTVKGYYFSSDTKLKDLISQNIEYVNNLLNTKADYLPISDLLKNAPRPDILEFNFSQGGFKELFINYNGITDVTVNDELVMDIAGSISIEQEIKNGILHYNVLYNKSRFNPQLVFNFAKLYKNLFISVLEDLSNNKMNRLISDYYLLNNEMYHHVIHSQNDTVKYYDRESTLHGLFEQQTFRAPDLTALVYGERRLSYRELNEKANQLAHYLIQHYDICPDELIPVCFNRSETMVIGILGVLKAGGAYVPIDPGYPVERLCHILSDTGSRLVLGEDNTVSKLYECIFETGVKGPAILNLDDKDSACEIQRSSRDNPVTGVRPDHLAYVIYTSGTTGRPKGVMIEHNGVVNLVTFMIRSHRFNEYTHVGCYSNYVFDAFVNEVFPVLCCGNTLWLFSDEQRLCAADLNRYIKDNGIEVSFIPPVLLKELLADTALKLIFAGGESFPDIDRNSYSDIVFLNEYGPTESTVCATSHVYHNDGNPLNIGRPIDNTSVYVLDSCLRPVPIGAVGELYIGGVGISRGYLNLPELSSERFLSNPFQTEEERSSGYNGRIYKTGDLVRILPNGDLEYLGRNDSQIKIRGYRIEAGEIETALVGLQGIRQAVVECRENITGLKYLAAYYVSDSALKSDFISLLLSEVLPDYMIPSAYVHLKALPVTINGKVDRKSLPEPLFTGETEYVSPQTPLQEQLADIYGEVLGLDPGSIGIHDDFFRLGGNSIMAIKLVNKIYQKTGRKAPGGMVFSNKSIVSLSQALESLPDFGEEDIRPAIVRHPREQYLSFGQERLWFIENYEGGSDVYNIPMILRLDKETDLRLLQEALDMLLERHEILRTLILMDSDGSGYQIVSDQSLELPLVKVGSLEDFMQVVNWELNERFNLQEELPVRVKVLDYEDDYYLSLVIHHIAFDGWSIGIFLRDLNSIYQSLSSGILPVLPSLPFQYKDFALWQRKYVTDKILDKQLGYWLGELSGFETLNLPLDFQRPSRISYEGKTLSFSISSEISSRLRIVSKNLGVSLYSVMLSGYYLMLSSYSGQEDLIIGTPVANRHYPGLENLIGFFVNILVLRQKLDFNVSVRDFIISVSSGVLGGQIHQDLPFEKLVDAFNLEQDSSRHPLFQVMFGLQSFGPVTAEGTDENCFFHLFDSGIENETAMFDLTTMIDDQREELCGTFNFAKSLFKETTIERMISTYQYILKQFSDLFQGECSDVRLSEIHWVDEEILGLRGICSDYDKGVTLHGLFEQQTFRAPDLTALVYGERRLSYRELNEKANQLAHYLIQHYDICPDELIPVCFNRSEKMVIGILGVLKAGALMHLLIQAIL